MHFMRGFTSLFCTQKCEPAHEFHWMFIDSAYAFLKSSGEYSLSAGNFCLHSFHCTFVSIWSKLLSIAKTTSNPPLVLFSHFYSPSLSHKWNKKNLRNWYKSLLTSQQILTSESSLAWLFQVFKHDIINVILYWIKCVQANLFKLWFVQVDEYAGDKF